MPEQASHTLNAVTFSTTAYDLEWFHRYSSLTRLQRVISYMYCFIDRVRKLQSFINRSCQSLLKLFRLHWPGYRHRWNISSGWTLAILYTKRCYQEPYIITKILSIIHALNSKIIICNIFAQGLSLCRLFSRNDTG